MTRVAVSLLIWKNVHRDKEEEIEENRLDLRLNVTQL
jgi:hypothetical protein